ncbi:membrane-associated protease RseP (regulator of RpoE activity) [Rhodopirellula rubra]|uniref:Membrane-associated protease RseP (Regulator of RpoE activity) n=1 Tax=Aporhodopirellula rubra TaxID=980271 RepID=A0A7W5E1B2_9BACT|nr:PDZ domain-containing protein [Aporhodopirellula rubra]MBB3208364.1 membrane-associated protease RseP (regulator of RpoE activity) [Aporhodopirellula rubra]
MLVSVCLKKSRSVCLSLASVFLFVMMQGVFCQPASAQRLLDRWRARIEARRIPQPPVTPPYQSPANSGSPRVLATPVPGQGGQSQGASGSASAEDAEQDETSSPTFGIEVSPVASGRYRGLQVLGFTAESNAPKMGIRLGDVIVSIDGVRTDSMEAVAAAQRRVASGTQAVVHILRGGRLYQTKLATIDGDDSASDDARLSAKPPVDRSKTGPTLARPRGSLGLEARDASPQRGVLVVTVKEGSAGERSGIKPDDRIVSAAGRLVRDTSGLVRELALLNPGESVTLGIVRGDSMREIEAEMGGPGGVPAQSATDLKKTVEGKSVLDTSEPNQESVAETPADQPSAGESLLGGVGSALGSFFSGQSTASEADASGNLTPASPGNDSELPAPNRREVSPPTDPLALPEDRFGDETLPPPAQN